MRKPVSVLVYPVRRNAAGHWEYLLLRRIPVRGGFWQGVSGGVEGEEDTMETAKREMAEETGLVPLAIEKVDYTYSLPVEAKWRHAYPAGTQEVREYVFVSRVSDKQAVSMSPEHDSCRWCMYEEALAMLKWPENIEALRRSHELVLQSWR